MAGVYIHIPFCKSRCKYCDFYSTLRIDLCEVYVTALIQEIRKKSHILHHISTIYFGGGTPSLLEVDDVRMILETIREVDELGQWKEVTLEANPGDLSLEKLKDLHAIGITRLSIGVQSFQSSLLHLVGRRHTRKEALQAVSMAHEAGFDNISIDLMYGLPGQTMSHWIDDLKTATHIGIQHVSAYCLTYEEGTPLYRDLVAGKIKEVEDELANEMQLQAENIFRDAGIYRYEVSNYALPGHESQHNSNYWTHEPYVGIGAGAHGFDGKRIRSWNVDDIEAYISYVKAMKAPIEYMGSEYLTDGDLYNEIVMLGLRTTKGVDIKRINPQYLEHFNKKVHSYKDQGWLKQENGYVSATMKGFRLLNQVIEGLML